MQRVGRYHLEGQIGRGGMGAVYRARDPASGQAVALKVLLGSGSETVRKRFAREAEALAEVTHPGVVRLLDRGFTPQGQPYLVLELVEGESLAERLARAGPLDADDAVALVRSLCEAVAACHAAGVLHRDLKPGNVLIDRRGRAKLVDFGLVRDTSPSTSRTQLTSDGQFLGSPGFWAPEQAEGRLDAVGERTDVYGLGAVLFALLTGDPPHRGESLTDLLQTVLAPKPAPSSLNPAVPAWLDRVVLRALAVEPGERYASAQALAEALGDGASQAPARPGRAQLGATLLVGVGLALAVALVVGSNPPRPAASPAAPASPAPAAPADPTSALANALALIDRAAERGQRGDLRGALADLDAALADLDAALGAAPELGRLYYNRGVVRSELGDVEGALADYAQALRLDPEDADAHFNRGNLRKRRGDRVGALEDYAAALRLQPGHAQAHYNRGNLYAEQEDWSRALEDYTAAIELDSGFASAYRNRAAARTVVGDPQGVIDDCSAALGLGKVDSKLYSYRGQARAQLGAVKLALEDYTAAIRLAPAEDPVLHEHRALLFERASDWEGAAQDYTHSLRLLPGRVQTLLGRAAARTKARDLEGALEDYSAVLQQQPDHAQASFNRGVVRHDLGDREGALADYDAAIRLDPNLAAPYFNRGKLLGAARSYAAAKQDLERYLALVPDSDNAPDARVMLARCDQALAERAGPR